MTDNKQNIEFEIERIVNSGYLKESNLYQISDFYFDFEKDSYWIINGGIELVFPNGAITFGWKSEFNMFNIITGKFNELYEFDNYKTIKDDGVSKLKTLAGKKVTQVDLKWIEFEVYDPDLEDFVKKETVIEINLEFDSKEKLQIASINYELTVDDQPYNFRNAVDSELLIALNRKFDLNNAG
ncbi:hypothetical protein ATE92_0102 [Ulvibacter sp. MAR_2010_11]|uniref:hypothetical protein n=1 Tax=Ulvibacter sp. MAR_2010_11 TaxID=1250229 RepID=UPI000C2C0D92|nr:hypothetical protein [Ulvibacter sp. MAR_2010_11]PKA81979.1 hypothetical protein ATE92_0102 [Ulvibacter sp. MAR_2010_11]